MTKKLTPIIIQELCRHFESNNLQLNIEDFDFLLDPALKKIRNIWKELKKTSQKPGIILPQVNPAPPLSSPDLGAEPSTEPGAKSNIEPVSESSPVIQPEPPVTSSPKEPPRNPLKTHEAVKMSPKPGGRSVETSPQSSRMGGAATQSPRMGGAATQSLPGGSGLVGWDGERGVRCNLVNCNKLFRNDKLLLQHVKVTKGEKLKTDFFYLSTAEENFFVSCIYLSHLTRVTAKLEIIHYKSETPQYFCYFCQTKGTVVNVREGSLEKCRKSQKRCKNKKAF